MDLICSYSPNYFSVDDILTTQERIPCRFLQTIPHLGMLDPSSEGEDLLSGTKLELPFWLAQSLSSSRQPIVATEVPKVFRETYREVLKADACAVDLRKLNVNFYEFGCYVVNLDRRDEIGQVLLQSFKRRFRHLMNLSEQLFANPMVIDKLDALERKIYNRTFKARMKLNTWLNKTEVRIKAADMVCNHKKRKRFEDE